jgi:agmatinase
VPFPYCATLQHVQIIELPKMTDLSKFDPNLAGNPNNNIFGLPFSEEEAEIVILPVPWEVTVSFNAGTARAAEHVFKASLQVDLFDTDVKDGWKHGFFMRHADRKILMKSDYLRKEAELFIDYISKGEVVEKNSFMCKSLKEINEGGIFLNNWVYEQTRDLLNRNKLVGLFGGDHSTPLGFFRALSEKHNGFGILQIDAHCDLRKSYEGFTYSHASIMYNALNEIPSLQKIVQVGVRDLCQEEWDFLGRNQDRVVTYFDKNIKERLFEGENWKQLCDEIIHHLPHKVLISFDVDGLDRKSGPNTGTPVPGGLETEQVFYLFKKILASGRELIGFDICEVGVGESQWDANVGARLLWKLCNLMVSSRS